MQGKSSFNALSAFSTSVSNSKLSVASRGRNLTAGSSYFMIVALLFGNFRRETYNSELIKSLLAKITVGDATVEHLIIEYLK